MMLQWPNHRSENDGSGTRMPFPVSIHHRQCGVSSAIRKHALSRSYGAQKNGVRGLRARAVGLVRPQDAASAAICRAGTHGSISSSRFDASIAGIAAK